MTDRWAVALAAAAGAGALLNFPVPLLVAAAVVGVAAGCRRRALLCVGVLLLSSSLAARSYDGLRAPVDRRPVRSTATLVTDPKWLESGALRAHLRLSTGRRVEAFARGPATSMLRDLLAGERVEVEGRLTPVPPVARRFLDPRHVSARLQLTAVTPSTAPAAVPARIANGVRRTLVRGAERFDPSSRGLFLGFVLGDDREQPPEVVDDFRASGLSHLLAVSGQNVAFVLALAMPFLRRFEVRGRLVAGLVVLGGFGVITRWEPSVLRAVAMAGLVMLTSALGRPQSSMRILALAVTALLLIDPLLVSSVGFLLSVGACVGIAALAARLERALPGPALVREPLALTLAAQAGVAPVALSVFGGLPVASLPANLLAAPAAGPVMSWGVAAGIPAGLLGGSTADALHLPTRLLVDWTGAVARVCARLPLGSVGWSHLGLVVAALAVTAAARHWSLLPVPLLPALVTVLLVPAADVALTRAPPATGHEIASGVRLWRSEDGATVLVTDDLRAGPVLAALRRHRVDRIDLLVTRRGGRPTGRALAAIGSRVQVRATVGPSGHQLARAMEATSTTMIRAGPWAVRFTQLRPLEAEVATCTVAACAWRSATGSSTSPPALS